MTSALDRLVAFPKNRNFYIPKVHRYKCANSKDVFKVFPKDKLLAWVRGQ